MYYFIGIKGSGMASLACILNDCGEEVAGSDIDKYIFTQKNLEDRKIPLYSFDQKNIKDGMNVIIGNAFDEHNVEVMEAKHNPHVKTYTYPQMLGLLVSKYHSICVCGTHGKTGTTGMLAHLFDTVHPTGYLIGDGTGHMPKDAQTFILEACEYQRNFLAYHPDYAILLNIELDHVDYYRDMDDYLNAFETFINQCKKGIAIFGDEETTHQIKINIPHLYYGIHSNNDVYATNIIEDVHGVRFDCFYQKKHFGRFNLPLFGKQLLWNALGVITIGIMNGLDATMLQNAMASFEGVKRRFSVEEWNENVYIDDYAHHPTAIRFTIAAAKQKYPQKKLIAIFKPDRYSRIAYFLKEFKNAFDLADDVYLCDFPLNATKEEGINITIDDLLQCIPNAHLLKEDKEGASYLADLGPAVYLFMSSKDIYKLKNEMKSFQ